MAVISVLFASFLIFIPPASSFADRRRPPAINDKPSSSDQIRQVCKATRYQQRCESSLSRSTKTNPMEIIQSALSVSEEELCAAQSKVKLILEASAGNANRTTATNNCIEYLRNSAYRLKLAADVFPHQRIKDGRAWIGSRLAYQNACWSALKYVNDTKMVVDTMSFLNMVSEYTSNALCMMVAYDVNGDKTPLWSQPKTERDGFWEAGVSGGKGSVPLAVPTGLKADVTMCKGGGCKYRTVQEVVNAAPDWGQGRRFVILVKVGVYKETVRVGLEKQNVVVLGEGMGKTVVTGSASVAQTGMTTYSSATVGVIGDGFMARDLTIENTAGAEAHQAVAFRTDNDQSVIENCEFLGNQDTLYAHSLRQFYKSCRIKGNIDFIFGNSASIFQDCTILIAPRQLTPEKGGTNVATAQGRVDPAQSTGFVFQNCLVNGTEEYMRLYYSNPKVHKSFLRRPWKEFSRTVYIGCKLEALITPEGWSTWTGDFALKTLYYGEFGNGGKGSDLSRRVSWSSRILQEHVNVYSITNVIQGDQWKLK